MHINNDVISINARHYYILVRYVERNQANLRNSADLHAIGEELLIADELLNDALADAENL